MNDKTTVKDIIYDIILSLLVTCVACAFVYIAQLGATKLKEYWSSKHPITYMQAEVINTEYNGEDYYAICIEEGVENTPENRIAVWVDKPILTVGDKISVKKYSNGDYYLNDQDDSNYDLRQRKGEKWKLYIQIYHLRRLLKT